MNVHGLTRSTKALFATTCSPRYTALTQLSDSYSVSFLCSSFRTTPSAPLRTLTSDARSSNHAVFRDTHPHLHQLPTPTLHCDLPSPFSSHEPRLSRLGSSLSLPPCWFPLSFSLRDSTLRSSLAPHLFPLSISLTLPPFSHLLGHHSFLPSSSKSSGCLQSSLRPLRLFRSRTPVHICFKHDVRVGCGRRNCPTDRRQEETKQGAGHRETEAPGPRAN
jgi:hypothetical protein